MPKHENKPGKTFGVISYVPLAFLWWAGILVVSLPIFSGMFNHGGDTTFETCFTFGWIAVSLGVPTFIHGTWKMAVAMLAVIAVVAIVVVAWFVVNLNIGHG